MDFNEFTDKYSSGLTEVYKELLAPYKDRPVTLLEIGVYKGGSLLFFQELLPQAKIYGIDILPRPEVVADQAIITKVLDQNDTAGLII